MNDNNRLVQTNGAKLRIRKPVANPALRNPAWIMKNYRLHEKHKSMISLHLARDVIPSCACVLMDHGTTFNSVPAAFETIYEHRTSSLALELVTTSISLCECIREAQLRSPGALKGLKITLTGGNVHDDLHCMFGEFAIRGIKDPTFKPSASVLGVYGLSAHAGTLDLAYAFSEETPVKSAILTKASGARYLVCDYSKIGQNEGFSIQVSPVQLFQNTSRLVLVTNAPETIPDLSKREFFQEELEKVKTFLTNAVRVKEAKGKECEIRLVTKTGHAKRVIIAGPGSAGSSSLSGCSEIFAKTSEGEEHGI